MAAPAHVVGRYALFAEIAAGGMATVHFGRLMGPVGFSRTVAIKRLHPQYAKNPEFVSMFLDEARVAARVRHPNVVSALDVVATDGELFIVMEYVQGESLARLVRAERAAKRRIEPRVAASILCGVLHAAHEARDERGEPLGIVHRDVSPQNILVGSDGTARVLDFGVAKAAGRIQTTREGHFKGKISYMAPEQFQGDVTRQTDVYAASIVLWEALTGERLFQGDDEIATLSKALEGRVKKPSTLVPDLNPGFDDVVMRGLEVDTAKRFATARDMALALERVAGLASPSEVGAWVDAIAADVLTKRSEAVARIESSSAPLPPGASDLAAQLQGRESREPITSPSNVAPVTATRAPAPPSSKRAILMGLFVFAGVAAIVFLGLRMRRPADSPVPPASLAVQAPAPEPSLSIAPPAASSASTATVETPVTSATAQPSASTPAAAKRPPAKPARDCNPPYTVDAQGHQHFKVECL